MHADALCSRHAIFLPHVLGGTPKTVCEDAFFYKALPTSLTPRKKYVLFN